jgi:hypothetical protein
MLRGLRAHLQEVICTDTGIMVLYFHILYYSYFWWGNLRVRDNLGDPGIYERIILRWIFRKWDVEVWTGSSWLTIGTGGEHL